MITGKLHRPYATGDGRERPRTATGDGRERPRTATGDGRERPRPESLALRALDEAGLWLRYKSAIRAQIEALPWWSLERLPLVREVERLEALATAAMGDATDLAGRRIVGVCRSCDGPVSAAEAYYPEARPVEIHRQIIRKFGTQTPIVARAILTMGRMGTAKRYGGGNMHRDCAASLGLEEVRP